MYRLSKVTLAAAALLAAIVLLAGGAARAQTIRVEAESFLQPDGNSTVGSGPNATSVVLINSDASMSGGKFIAYFVAWDWLEYTVTAPADGVYNLTFYYSDGWTPTDPCPLVLSFLTTGKQFFAGNVHPTTNWGTFVSTVLAPDDSSPAFAIPLKAGVNRFRVAIRPDFVLGGGMNWDYMDFTKTADPYPALAAVSGKVTSTIGGVATPLKGALVSEGTDYHVAANMTRTDATGAYTLYLPAGSHDVTAFVNGFQLTTTTVAPPGTLNFDMVMNGRYETELLDSTNTGGAFPDDTKGVQPAYDSGTASGKTLSNHGEIVNALPGKYAEFRNVYAPADGVYDLSIHHASLAAAGGNVGDPGYFTWTVNGGSTVKMTYGATSIVDFLTYADSAPMLITLKKGINTLRMTDANAGTGGNPATPSSNVDYFTISPSTQPHGTLKVIVTNSANNNNPVSGASITVPVGSPRFTGVTGSDGTLSIPVPPGAYTVTASKSGASPVTAAPATVADGQTVNVPISLAIAGVAVEAEDYVAGGPTSPASAIGEVPSASNSKVVSGFTGAWLQNWLEWNVTVADDGLYRMTLQYAIPPDGDAVHPVYPVDLTITASPSTFHARTTNIPRTDNGDTYGSYDLQDELTAPILVPLKAGLNKLRISMDAGTINLDYIQFAKLQAYPALRTITGKISGSDGTGSAGIAGATVWANSNGLKTSYAEAQYSTTTDAAGRYTLNAVAGGAFLNARANGFASPASAVFVGASTTTKDLTLNINNPNALSPAVEQIEAELLSVATPNLSTNEKLITFTNPGSYFEIPFSVARTGLYQVGMNYSSGWIPEDGLPVKTTWTVNGIPQQVDFAKTTGWADIQYFPNIATIPLVAGGNTVRVLFNEAGANIDYLTLRYIGALPATDINTSGKTDLIDAVIYARRLGGLDSGAKPDLTGDGVSNFADVMRILRVAGGLS